MSEHADDLWRAFNAASVELKKGIGGKPGDAAEKKYGQAYLSLVKSGLAPRIKKKYRGGLK
jgi:hypothetical protein